MGLYMDVDITQYLRNPFIDLAKHHTRLLSLTHLKKMFQYKKVRIKYFSSRNSNDKAIAIQNKINKKSLNESDMKEINNLDITITKGALFSEKKLKKTYITANGLKQFITAYCTCLIGDSSAHKS